jgi:hypothetical protein
MVPAPMPISGRCRRKFGYEFSEKEMIMIEAKRHNGSVVFDGRFVAIVRKGALARMTIGKGEKRIPISSITAVK